MMNCPHCNTSVQPADFCGQCHRILPVGEAQSHYSVLGYDQERLNLDLADLDRRFFELSRKFHPDRFATKSALEVEVSHQRSSSVNNAYRTLKSPVTRAKYMVEKHLGSIEEKSAKVPMDMAELFFEVQDVLDTIRESNGSPPEDAVRQVRQAEVDLKQKVNDLEAALQSTFSAYDANPRKEKLEEIKEVLSERSYIKSFLRQLEEE